MIVSLTKVSFAKNFLNQLETPTQNDVESETETTSDSSSDAEKTSENEDGCDRNTQANADERDNSKDLSKYERRWRKYREDSLDPFLQFIREVGAVYTF